MAQQRDGSLQIGRQRRGDFDGLSGAGVAEAEALGVQGDAIQDELVSCGALDAGIEIAGEQALGAAVVGVDGQGVAEDREVGAHLMQAAGTRAQLDRGDELSEPLDRSPRGHAGLAAALAGTRRTHAAAADRDQRAVDLARRGSVPRHRPQ